MRRVMRLYNQQQRAYDTNNMRHNVTLHRTRKCLDKLTLSSEPDLFVIAFDWSSQSRDFYAVL